MSLPGQHPPVHDLTCSGKAVCYGIGCSLTGTYTMTENQVLNVCCSCASMASHLREGRSGIETTR